MHQIQKYKLDHVAFWTITLLFYAFTRKELITTSGWLVFATDVIMRNILIAATCYLNIYFLFERFFKTARYLTYGTILVGLILVYAAVQAAVDWTLDSGTHAVGQSQAILYDLYYNFSIGIFYIAFTLALELSKRWYGQKLLIHKMQTEKLEAELAYLRAQLNPHFLFNSINSIFFQIDKENAGARESLHKFSELLRYQLYECNEDKIPIEKETMYLESYVDLQRLRKNGESKIRFNTAENVKDFDIAPLLLLPFVENAFKHLSENKDSENIIAVDMARQNGCFVFSILNSANLPAIAKNEVGIGLKNVRRRLDLLYANKYKLDIQKTESEYSVKLEIEIS